MDFVVQVRQRVRYNVSEATFVWSLVMAVVLVAWEVSPATDGRDVVAGVLVTVVFGAYLGWRRRWPYVFVAPMVGAVVAWVPWWIAAIIRHGVVKGIFVGFVLDTVGGVLVGTAEFLCLAGVSMAVRAMRGGRGRGDDRVVVFGPDDRR